MNKKKQTLLALMMALLMVLSVAMLVACDKNVAPSTEDETKDTVTATEGLLISNSDFKSLVTGEGRSYPLAINSWTGASMYSSGSFPVGVIAGAISLEEALYNENKSKWNDDDGALYNKLKSHYSADKDAINNALMIYMPTEAEIENKEDYGPTAYGYTSTSFSLGASKYYKLSIDVLTHNIAGSLDKDGEPLDTAEPGARIYISTNTYEEFAQINTNGEWTTYTVYFESAATSATSLTVQLGLGKYTSSYKEGLTTGYAFFDNVLLEEVESGLYTAAREAEETGTTLDDGTPVTGKQFRETTHTLTLKVPNGRFDFGATTVATGATPSNWTSVTETDSPTGQSYNGIIDVANFANNFMGYSSNYFQDVSSSGTASLVTPASRLGISGGAVDTIGNFGDNRVGTNVFMLSQQRMAANGIRSGKQIVIEKGKHYEISISLYTFDIHGAGVTLELAGSGETIQISGISQNKSNENPINGIYEYTPNGTNGGWTTYTFFIEGNQYRDMSYNLTLWLGTGSKYDNTEILYRQYTNATSFNDNQVTYSANGTFSTGWAFFDELNLAEINEERWSKAGTDHNQANTDFDVDASDGAFGGYNKISLRTDNLFLENGSGISADFLEVSNVDNNDYDNNTLGTPGGFNSDTLFDKLSTDKTLPIISAANINAGVVSLDEGADFSAYGLEHPGVPYSGIISKRALMLQSKVDGYYLIETNNFTIQKNSFLKLSLWVKTVDIKATSGLYVYVLDSDDAILSSFTLINTTDYTDEDEPSEWTEYTFYLRGNQSEDNDVKLQFTLGTGTRWSSSTLAKGAAFISNLSLTGINYSDFNSVSTGTYVKTINLSETTASSSISNGNFSLYSFSDTKGLNEKNAGGNPVNGQLKENDYAGVPQNWNLSDNTYKENGDDAEDYTYNGKNTYVDDKNFVAGILEMNKTPDGKFFRQSYQINKLLGNDYASKFDKLYGDETNEAEYLQNPERIGGPYVLALAGLNDNKYSRGYTTAQRLNLSAATNYRISVWAKTLSAATFSIYLTGESTGQTYFEQSSNFVVKTDGETEWTEYVFYVEVGLTSVSLSLQLRLGYDESISGKVENADKYSSGVVLFDNAVYSNSLTSDEFDAITADTVKESERKLSFLGNGFDSTSSASNPDSLTAPSGWSGAADTDQDASDTKGGVVYNNASELPTYAIDAADAVDELYKDLINVGYVSLFGKEYDLEDYEIEQDEIIAARETYPDKSDIEIETILRKLKLYNDMKDNYISTDVLLDMNDKDGKDISSVIGNNFLVINNTDLSAYRYTGPSYNFAIETSYRVSVWVRTYNATGAGASIELYLGSANETENPLIFKNITGTTGWTKYTFYVRTLDETVSSVTLRLKLGEYDADNPDLLSTGYAMFDAVEIEIIDNDVYENFEEQMNDGVLDPSIQVRQVVESSSTGTTEGNEPGSTEVPSTSFNLDYLWWMIPTIIIALVIIAVVAVYFFKKFRKPKKSSFVEESTEAIEEKRSKYEDYNE